MSEFTPIEVFDAPDLARPPLEELRALPDRCEEFRALIRASGTVDAFWSRSLVTLPYMRRYGLYEACWIPAPYVWFTNRVFIVRWTADDGSTKTLLAEPTDHELGDKTPFFAEEKKRIRRFGPWLENRMVERHATLLQVLSAAGIAPEEVDYLSFDHLHTQDVRRLIGTHEPVKELGHSKEPVPAWFPNAKLIVQAAEIAHLDHGIHPFQQRFFQPPDRYDHLPKEKLLVIDGDVLLGPGVALMRTPGHTLGNHSLVVNTAERGIFTSSENGISADSYAPRHSKIPGVRKWAKRWGYEVVMNFNTPEYASLQYNSMVKERLVADPVKSAPGFRQTVPSSELVHHPLAPGIRPTLVHGDLTLGELTRATAPRGEGVAASSA
jgi:hypothetical protein